MVDSTNAEVPGFVASERELQPVIDRVFGTASGRVIVACSPPTSTGSSRSRHRALARAQGRLRRPVDGAQHGRGARPRLPAWSRTGVIVTPDELAALPDEQVVLICTGSQGEPMAALSRIANRDHRISVGRGRHGPARVLADPRQRERGLPRHQRADPAGREGRAQGQRAGARLRARRCWRAALLLQHRAAAQRDARPRRVAAPARQRRARGADRRARASACCSPRTAGSSTSSTASPAVTGAVPCGYVYVDGSSVGDITEASLKDRRMLGTEGFVTCVVVVDSVDRQGHRRARDPGPRGVRGRGDLRRRSCRGSARPSRTPCARATPTRTPLQQIVRRRLGKWVNEKHRRRPMIVPVVVEA